MNDTSIARPSAARLLDVPMNIGSDVAILLAPAICGITFGAPSSAAGTSPLMHRRPQEAFRLHKEGGTTRTTQASPTPVAPTCFEGDITSSTRARGRIMRRKSHTIHQGHRRWPFSRSPSPVRSGEAATFPSLASRQESSTLAAQVDDRTSKVRVCAVCFSHHKPVRLRLFCMPRPVVDPRPLNFDANYLGETWHNRLVPPSRPATE